MSPMIIMCEKSIKNCIFKRSLDEKWVVNKSNTFSLHFEAFNTFAATERKSFEIDWLLDQQLNEMMRQSFYSIETSLPQNRIPIDVNVRQYLVYLFGDCDWMRLTKILTRRLPVTFQCNNRNSSGSALSTGDLWKWWRRRWRTKLKRTKR